MQRLTAVEVQSHSHFLAEMHLFVSLSLSLSLSRALSLSSLFSRDRPVNLSQPYLARFISQFTFSDFSPSSEEQRTHGKADEIPVWACRPLVRL